MKELEDMRNDELLMAIIAGIQILRDNEHKQGFEDGQKEKLANVMIYDHEVAEKMAYERGLNEAWKAVRKIIEPMYYGGYSPDVLCEIFDVSTIESVFKLNTAAEAMAKIKEYEDKQKCKQNEDEIKVGYEVYNIDRDNKRIVTAIDGNKAIQLCSDGKYTVDNIDTLHWTGREDLRIKKVLEKITKPGAY